MKQQLSGPERIQHVKNRIVEACLKSGRSTDEVKIVAVSKYVGLNETEEMIDLGMNHLGENRWQDAKEKWETIGNRVNWHFLGHLQTNKVRDIVGKFTFLHSLDRLALAQEINKRGELLGTVVQAFIQLNVSGEETKYGLTEEEVYTFAKQLQSLKFVRVLGLMTMAPHEANPEETRPVFRRLREIKDELNKHNIFSDELTELSMGMSNDYAIAVEEGATWLRLGSVLFKPQ